MTMLALALATVFFPFPSTQKPRDVTPNGSFTQGTGKAEGWTEINLGSGKVVVARDTQAFASAPASLRLATDGKGDGSVSAVLPDVAGTTLRVEGKVRVSGSGVEDAQVAIFAQDANYKMVMWQPVASRWHFKDNVWSDFSGTVKMPKTAVHARTVLLIKGEGQVWLDDLKVISTPSSVPIAASTGTASNLVDVIPVTNQIISLHFSEGYVIHHKAGQKRGDEKVVIDPLDLGLAMKPTTYSITSSTDENYKNPTPPLKVSRKSKGSDFAWFVDRWVGDHAENDRPDHVEEHWIYLTLPQPIRSGTSYSIGSSTLAKSGKVAPFTFDERSTRSESVHVNLLGYVPSAPQKFGYVYQWLGQDGGLDLKAREGKKFWLVDRDSNAKAFEGIVAFRKSKDNVETQQISNTPGGNFLQADVYECDFSDFTKPGRYVLSVEGVGCSFPFKIDADVYREAFRVTTRGLFHNRSGIELKKANTDWTRPAPHNPMITPGFAGKLKYTSSRSIDWTNADSAPADKPAIEAGLKGAINVAGWYQDAGDWDSYPTHMRVPMELLLAYQMAPKNFAPGELNLPESGNGLPDILNEAGWLPRFAYRLRKELLAKKYGTGGIGLRICGDHFGGDTGPKDVGQGSWQDVDRLWIASGEDPISTFWYASAAAQMAKCLKIANKPDPEKIDWAQEARACWAWAMANTRPGDDKKDGFIQARIRAAAALFTLTGDQTYEKQLDTDTADFKPETSLWMDILGPSIYVLGGGPTPANPTTLARVRATLLHWADGDLESSRKRGLRWGGDWGMPMLVGQQSTPLITAMAVGATLLKKSDPAKSQAYLAAIYTTCDYFLGTNPLNQTYVTGLGPRSPRQVFHMDSWYSGRDKPIPGIVPYGPWLKNRDQGVGPWDSDWANKSLYPDIDEWPGAERWMNNRCAPMNSEFTIHQNTAPAAAIFGFLCGRRG